MDYDDIVVGAGAAGSVVAARLSERADRRVLLIEAGADIVPEPPSITSPYPISHAVADFQWPGLTAAIKAPLTPGAPTPRLPYLQARTVGGGGSLMGMIALRGLPADYDAWRDAGAAGWGWNDVLPVFRRLERDLDFRGGLHGDAGAIPIRRHALSDWSPFARAVGEAFEADGFPFIADANGDFRDGHVAIPVSSLADRRFSSASALLDGRARTRENLTILPATEAQAVLIENGRATGVETFGRQGPVPYRARRVILCAGAIKSPQLLMQSGIGPASELRRAGIEPVRDLPGVGRNLHNHPAIYLSALLPRKCRQPGGPFIYNALRYSSGLPDCPMHDMMMPVINRTAWHALGHSIAALGVCVYKSLSRGRVSLVRQEGGAAPNIDLGLFADRRDLTRLVDGYRRVFRYLASISAAMPGLTVFAPTSMEAAARLAVPGRLNGMLGRLIATGMYGPTPLRRRMLQGAGIDPSALIADDERLTEFVYRYASPMYHPAGTCRIGAPGDPAAVVDPRLRVIGVEGLCVADASVMPSIVRANTNIPTIMVGEKAAAIFQGDRSL